MPDGRGLHVYKAARPIHPGVGHLVQMVSLDVLSVTLALIWLVFFHVELGTELQEYIENQFCCEVLEKVVHEQDNWFRWHNSIHGQGH